MTEKRIFKCVPLNNAWTLPGTKLDIKAIYRRPRRSIGEFDEIVKERGPDGQPLYDLCSPLPMRRHADWLAKGYEYVTVVCRPNEEGSPWPTIAAWLRHKELNPQEFLQHPILGTWNPKLYLATAGQVDVDQFADLRKAVEKFGSRAVLEVRQLTDPKFELPADLQDIEPGGNHVAAASEPQGEPKQRLAPLPDASAPSKSQTTRAAAAAAKKPTVIAEVTG